MINLLEFIFSDFFIFCGFIIILVVLFEGFESVIEAITKAIVEVRNGKKNKNDSSEKRNDL